jgi:hypothetical protein
MKKTKAIAGFCGLCILFTALSAGKPTDQQTGENGFAVLELFTSEGCSSCPAADDAVAKLSGRKNVYALSFHVDYWDYLGWKDQFSNPAYSERQKKYGSLFHLSSIYTPQTVVNGKTEFVGSDETRLRNTIEENLRANRTYKISLQSKVTTGIISVSAITDGTEDMQFNLALVQNRATDHIQRGENQGKTLHHFNIVREFHSIPLKNNSVTDQLNLPPGLVPGDCSLIAYLQNVKTGKIETATSSDLR